MKQNNGFNNYLQKITIIVLIFRIGMDTDGPEYAWVCTWIMLKYAWICLKQNLKSLYKLRSIYRDSGIQNPAKNLKWSKKERLAKTN